MTNVKKMLLGIALLIVAAIGATFWVAGSVIGAIMFFGGLIVGGFFCIDGFLSVDKD